MFEINQIKQKEELIDLKEESLILKMEINEKRKIERLKKDYDEKVLKYNEMSFLENFKDEYSESYGNLNKFFDDSSYRYFLSNANVYLIGYEKFTNDLFEKYEKEYIN